MFDFESHWKLHTMLQPTCVYLICLCFALTRSRVDKFEEGGDEVFARSRW